MTTAKISAVCLLSILFINLIIAQNETLVQEFTQILFKIYALVFISFYRHRVQNKIIGGIIMKNSFYSAVLTLSIFTVIDRFLGFGFKIYLSRVLGASALGVYSVAFSFFTQFRR